jgi:hypothetical protein
MSKSALAIAEVVDVDGDPTPARGRPPIRLDTVAGTLAELAAVYRAVKHGRMDAGRGTKLTYILQVILRGHETAALEARIDALEASCEPKH